MFSLGFTAIAQKAELGIVGLDDDFKGTNMVLLSINQIDANSYAVVKIIDSASEKLSQASANSTLFNSAYLRQKLDNGDMITTRLNKVIIKNFVTLSSNDKPTESFTLQFEEEVATH